MAGKAVAAAVSLLVLAGCAAGPGAGGKPEEVVAKRAQARWAALISGDIPAAYAYLSPATRQTYSLEAYRGSIRAGFWRKAEMQSVQCQAEVCEATFNVTYAVGGTPVTTPTRENWVLGEGGWWYVFRPS